MINHIMVSFTVIIILLLLTDFPQKFSSYFNNSLLCKPEFSSATKNFLFLLKNKQTKNNNHSLASDWWEYTKSHFKENAKIFSKNSIAQEIVTISWQNLTFLLKTQKTTTLQQVTGGETPNLVLKKMLQLFLKTPILKKILKF